MSLMDGKIEESLDMLREEKYKLRVFQVTLLLEIDSEFGVEESLQAIRAIDGVTVVTAIDSTYLNNKKYRSKIRVKYHPHRETMTPTKYINQVLLPSIRGRSIKGVAYISRGEPERIS